MGAIPMTGTNQLFDPLGEIPRAQAHVGATYHADVVLFVSRSLFHFT
jgi:hypothetical protein